MTEKLTHKTIQIIRKMRPIYFLSKKAKKTILHFLIKINPKIVANMNYKRVFNRNIDWENPKDLIEKIYWFQLNTDTTFWTKCADKYLVREYVAEKGCSSVLNDLFGKWESVEEIDWESLPSSFVLKTNNSCGQVILVKNKDNLDIEATNKKIEKWLSEKYGYDSVQFHYTGIKPLIIAEKLLQNKDRPNSIPVDYKIWCFHGIPESVLVAYNRSAEGYSLSMFDLEWNNISELALNPESRRYGGASVPKPSSLNIMIRTAEKLSVGIPQVRVDFYDIDGKAVFGEMTFTTGYGSYNRRYYNYLGSKININEVEKIDSKSQLKNH